MEAVQAPVVHNPAKLWDDEIARKQLEVKAVPTNNAPRDIVQDIRKEPEWLIPEIRQWGSLHFKSREGKINWLIKLDQPREGAAGVTASDDFKKKCFRWLLTVEPDRVLAKRMFDFVWPETEPVNEQETRETDEVPVEPRQKRKYTKRANG